MKSLYVNGQASQLEPNVQRLNLDHFIVTTERPPLLPVIASFCFAPFEASMKGKLHSQLVNRESLFIFYLVFFFFNTLHELEVLSTISCFSKWLTVTLRCLRTMLSERCIFTVLNTSPVYSLVL